MKKNVLLLIVLCLCTGLSAQIKGVQHVILIGADGFGSFIMNDHKGSFPNLEKLMQEGSSSLQMRSVLPSSSAVNWASILMGAGPELHGFTEWGSQKPELPSRVIGSRGMFPGIFGLIRDHYPQAETGVFYSWAGIGYLFEKDAVTVEQNLSGKGTEVVPQSIEFLNEKKPMFSFIYFAQPDGKGHNNGWGSPVYVDDCKMIDRYVGDIMQAIKKNGMDKNTIVIFISDHGGIDKGHGGKTMQEMEVPYIVWGKHVKAGHTIEESLMVYDNASTIAHILGIQQPQVWIGRPIKSIFN